jgi:hypothetical protein
LAGFGFLHDGAIDSVARFLSAGAFSVESDQEVADLVALMMAFSGSELDVGFVPLGNSAPQSQDTHAGVGQQHTLRAATQLDDRLTELLTVAMSDRVDLLADSPDQGGLLYDPAAVQFTDGSGTTWSPLALMAVAGIDNPVTLTLVPAGLGERLAFDRDGDGLSDDLEISQGSDPTDKASQNTRPLAGLWFNPARSGHGIDLQFANEQLIMTWYTYNDDGTPTWYLAAGPYASDWQADLLSFSWDHDSRTANASIVGSASLQFSDAQHVFAWDIDGRTSQEPFQYFVFTGDPTIQQHTSSYFNASDSGWGITVGTQGGVIVSVIYYYNEFGEPVWALGAGENDSLTSVDMYHYNGFCPDCEFVETQAELVGAHGLQFNSDRSIDYAVSLQSPTRSLNWVINDVRLIPLSNEFFDPALQ